MKHQSLQPLASRPRRLPVKPHLYWVWMTIVLSGLFLGVGMFAPPSVTAASLPIHAAGFRHQTVLVSQMANATVQLPSNVADRLRQALSKQTKIPAAKLKVVEAAPKTWANGCLGLAKADEICTQALIEGWRVVFADGSRRWVYRADKQARVYRLEP